MREKMEVSTNDLINYQRIFGVFRTLAFWMFFCDFFNSENGIMEFIFAMGSYQKKNRNNLFYDY